jgi:ADP-L-glycero-D-manno-heptose 6-epimerase
VGSNIVHALNERGRRDIMVVDDLDQADLGANLARAALADYVDKTSFLDLFGRRSPRVADVSLVIHQGASTSTTDPDGRAVMANNYEYTRTLVDHCVEHGVALIYASSAAVYGTSADFAEEPANEAPLNVYGWSKLLVDKHVRSVLPRATSQVVGLRYFNVYGPGEDHKGPMASIVTQLHHELVAKGTATIFGASHGLDAGQQERDFVSVRDVVDVVLWFAERPERSGIYNCGSGRGETFESVARAVVREHGSGDVRFKDFPVELTDRYQPRTVADLTRLRAAGYDGTFEQLADGVRHYLGRR